MQLSRRQLFPVFISVLLFFVQPGLFAFYGNSRPDTTKAHNFYIRSLEKMQEGGYNESMDLLDEASRLFGKKREWDRAIECRLLKTSAWSATSDKSGLIDFCLEALEFSTKNLGENHPLTGDCYNRLGELYYLEKENGLAEQNLDHALRVYSHISDAETLEKAKVYTNYGRLKKALSEYDSVEYFLDKALDIQLNLLDTLDNRLTKTYHTYASFYYQVGKIDQSIHYHNLVLQIEKKRYGELHREIADTYNNLGAAYQRKGDFYTALDLQQRALDIRLTTLDSLHPYIPLSYNNLANVYANLGDYEKSNKLHHEALRIRRKIFDENHRDIAMSYANIGSNLLYQGYPDKASVYFKKVIPIMESLYGPAHMLTSDAYENAGLPFYYTGRLDSAFYYLFKALTIREGVQNGINIKVARSYNNIGAIYKENRDYELALSYYFKSMELYKRLLGNNSYPLSGSYNNIGEVYHLTDDFERSVEYYKKALEIDIEKLGPDNPKLASMFLNLGSVSADMGNFEESFDYNKKALQFQVDAYGESSSLVASIYANMAMDYYQLDSLEKALATMKRAIQIREEVSGKSDPDLASDYTKYGMLLAKNGRKEEGLNKLYEGLSVNYFGAIDSTLSSIDPALIKDSNWFIETLVAITEFNNEYPSTRNEIERYSDNLLIYELISDISIELRKVYRFERSKLYALKQWDYLYSEAFETAAALYEITGDEEYFKKAFRFAGLKKTTALSDAILASQALANAGIPDSIIDAERALNSTLENLRQELMELDINEEVSGDRDAIESTMNSTIIDLNSLYLTIDKRYPDFSSLRSQYPDHLPEEIGELLGTSSLLLEFVVTDSLIYAIIIGKKGKWIEKIEVPPDFENRIINLLRTVKKYRVSDFISQSKEIYGLLIQPLEKHFTGIDKIITIPESYLLLLPFDILVSNENLNKNQDLSALDFFIQKFETVSHYSTDLWVRSYQTSESRMMNPDLKGFLGVAPVFDMNSANPIAMGTEHDTIYSDRSVVDRMSLQELPYSKHEVDILVAMFSGHGEPASGMIRSEATEENFRDKAGRFRYVHIATHGLLNPEKPELSGLVFWKDTSDHEDENLQLLISEKSNDGVLYTKEVYNLDLNADLVTLSACETGAGKIVKGEGLLSFVRGFTYAGVPNMLISYWKVNDKTTADFMVDFYGGVLSGDSYSTALRKAKLAAISDRSTSFPASWGNFVLIGY